MMRTLLAFALLGSAMPTGAPAITGRVVADDTGEPVVNARVVVRSANRNTLGVSDDAGRFTVPTASAGQYTISAAKSGYVTRRQTLAASVESVELRLTRAAVIAGRVADRTGEPIVNATVIVHAEATAGVPGNGLARDVTDDAGRYRLPGVPPGRVVVLAITMSTVASAQTLPNGMTVMMPTQTRTFFPGTADAASAERISLQPGEEHDGVNFVLGTDQVGPATVMFSGAPNQSAGPTTGPSGTIRGRVTAASGGALAGAQVQLLANGAPITLRSSRTDALGRFEFADVPPGALRVAAAKPGFEPARSSEAIAPMFPTMGASRAVEVREGDVSNVELELRRLGSVSGQVADELGDPIQGASVQLLHVRYERGRRRLVPSGVARPTDDRGRYRIFNVAAGQYVVQAAVSAANSSELPGYSPSYFPGSADASGAQFVPVAISQDVVGVDFSLAPVRTARVTGRIVDAAGQPTSAGTLQLRSDARAGGFGAVAQPARIGDDGVFEFSNVAPGAYVVFADRGRQNGSVEGEFAAVPIAVHGEDVVDLRIQTSAGSTIAGRIVFDAADSENRPRTSQVELTAVPIDFDTAPSMQAHADIRADWTFQMRGINGVRRLLPTQLPAGWAVAEVRVNGLDATDRPLAFGRPEQSLTDVEVVLTNRAAEVGGTVVDGNGRPAAGAVVVAIPVDRDRRYPMSRALRRASSGDDGTFHLSGLPGGAYYVAAVASIPIEGDDAWQDPVFLSSLEPSATTVAVGDGRQQVVTLRVER